MGKAVNRYRELRELAGVTLQETAKIIGVSFGTMWNFENQNTRLTDRQVAALEGFYGRKVIERLKRVGRSLGAGK